MSTHAILAVGDRDSWEGVYVHYDGYPHGAGHYILHNLAGSAKDDITGYVHEMIVEHPCGWQSLLEYEYDINANTGDYETLPRDPLPYPDKGGSIAVYTSHDADFCGAEWLYVIEPNRARLHVGAFILPARDDDWNVLIDHEVLWVADIPLNKPLTLSGANTVMLCTYEDALQAMERRYEERDAEAAALQRDRDTANEEELESAARIVDEIAPAKQLGPLFPLGHVVSTPGALDAFKQSGENMETYLKRHVTGDWGEVDEHDRQENDLSVKEGYRILSAYTLSTGVKVWIITEADRSATTFLLPDEY